MIRLLTLVFCLVVFTGLAVRGAAQGAGPQAAAPQAGAEPLPAFEVASVRVNTTAQMNRLFRPQPGGRFEATNMRLRDLVQFAYQVRNFQIEGGPDWMDTTSFDIVAKAPGEVTAPMPGGAPSPYALMMRSLLADRFKLVVHQETKEVPIYVLALARADGRLGPELAPSTTDCAALVKAAAGGVPPPAIQGDRIQCGLRIGPGRMDMGGFSFAEFANGLSMLLQRTVVNRTGLSGNYDAKIIFSPEQLPGLPMPPPGTPGVPPLDPNAPSIFTAVQEQLGLKLDSSRGPVPLLVIDRAEMPVED
jgi:uncharacterized protein (TIGR03435 family)